MSNALAIASVTRLLKDLLNDALVNGDISGDIGSDVTVTAVPPDRALLLVGDNQPSLLNIFLHRISRNPALANSDLPTRDGRGGLVARPRLALDLHYLLSAYASQELHSEILLGYAMELFHETPILSRGAIRAALQGGLNGSILPPAFQGDDPARLADQIELVRITPQPLSLDDISKLWTAFQTNYRTTVAYTVTVVLIERALPARSPLPVLSRGPRDPVSGRDAGIMVQTGLTPAVPLLTQLANPAIRLGDVLRLAGHHLDAGDARVRFTLAETGQAITLAPIAAPSPKRIEVRLPVGPPLDPADPLAGTGADPGAWRIGPYMADVVLSAGGRERVTNRLPLMLVPRASPAVAAEPAGTRISVGSSPRIRAGQSVSVIAGQAEAIVDPSAADVDQVSALFVGLAPGAILPVRLRVGGVESLVIDPSMSPPGFDPSQMVTVP